MQIAGKKRLLVFLISSVVLVFALFILLKNRIWIEKETYNLDFHLAEGSPLTDSEIPSLSKLDEELSKLAAEVIPSVVAIRSVGILKTKNYVYENKRFKVIHEIIRSTGSGVIVTREGHIVTNYHVVRGHSVFHITMSDNKTYQAELLGCDPNNDIAVLRPKEPMDVQPLPFARAKTVDAGQLVFSLGNSYSLGVGMTSGIVTTGVKYCAFPMGRRIQSDAAIHPGNSGGPLVNIRGEIVGINTDRFYYRDFAIEKGVSTLAFAIPANEVRHVFEEVTSYPQWMLYNAGISISSQPGGKFDKRLEYLKIPSGKGVFIDRVHFGSHAERLYVKYGDVIIGCNNETVDHLGDLKEILRKSADRPNLALTLWRGWRGGSKGEVIEIELPVRTHQGGTASQSQHLILLGAELDFIPVSEEIMHGAAGMKVEYVSPSSVLYHHLRPDDIIKSINGIEIAVEDSLSKLNDTQTDKLRIVYIRRGKEAVVEIDPQA